MKILVVAPIVAAEDSFLFKEVTDTYKSLAKEGVEIDVAFLKSGPSCIMNAEQELEALPDIIRIVKEKNDKYEAIILDCMGDPGIGVAREVSNTLIVGPLQSSMAFASTLGYKVHFHTNINGEGFYCHRYFICSANDGGKNHCLRIFEQIGFDKIHRHASARIT